MKRPWTRRTASAIIIIYVTKAPDIMPTNHDIAAIFNQIADILDIQGKNAFRIRAYRNAARIIDSMGQSLIGMYRENPESLKVIPGIGEGLREKIIEFCETEHIAEYEEIRETIPPGLLDMLKIPSFGPKRVKLVYDKLGIETVDALEQAAQKAKIRELPGMGEKSEAKLLKNIQDYRTLQTDRKSWPEAHRIMEAYREYLSRVSGIESLEAAGSYRRCRETIGDLDILITTKGDSHPIIDAFTAYPEVLEVIAKGDTKASVILTRKIQVDLRVVEPGSFGAALQYFTGSKEHNVAMRRLAKDRGLKLSEYGIFSGDRMLAGKTEEEVYAELGLQLIPPELRENRGEIAAAEQGQIPTLVNLDDIKGDLHVHTTYSDGIATISEMAEAAKERGYSYLAITDHSKAVTIANGLSEDRLLQQLDEIKKYRRGKPAVHVFSGIEVDIMSDGTLDYNDDILSQIDFVIASVHSKFDMSKDQMTERIVAAIRNPYVRCLAHPTGRKIGDRLPYQVDIELIIDAAATFQVALEINASPERLDLNEIYAARAHTSGVPLMIGTDAHRPDRLDSMIYGINIARRAWCERDAILNAWPLERLIKWLEK